MTDSPFLLEVEDLGRMAYGPAFAYQRQVHEAVLAGRRSPALLLVEHDPVITVSHRKGAGQHLLASPGRLAALGIDVQPTDRGGDITYHGPGQLVVYPILPLAVLGLNVGRYMRLLEQVVIAALGELGLPAEAEAGLTGVWARGLNDPGNVSPVKVCAMGVRVRRNVTMHGLALNVEPDLSHFDAIVPCGIADRQVGSLACLMGADKPGMERVKQAVVGQFRLHLARCFTADKG